MWLSDHRIDLDVIRGRLDAIDRRIQEVEEELDELWQDRVALEKAWHEAKRRPIKTVETNL